MQRRQFIENGIRMLLFAMLAAISGVLVVKRRKITDEYCRPGNLCQRCGQAKQCTLPDKSV